MLQEAMVSLLTGHHFQSIQKLEICRSFPNSQDHGFAQLVFDAKYFENAEPAMPFHAPFGGVHGKFRGVIFGEMRQEAEHVIPRGIRRALLPNVVQQPHRFPAQSKGRAKVSQALFKLMAQHRVLEDALPESNPLFPHSPERRQSLAGPALRCPCYWLFARRSAPRE